MRLVLRATAGEGYDLLSLLSEDILQHASDKDDRRIVFPTINVELLQAIVREISNRHNGGYISLGTLDYINPAVCGISLGKDKETIIIHLKSET